jgi:ABC-type antimicrobial peptide transport system permease subunit
MRLLPWDYGVRNLLRRPLRSLLTALGLTLVVFLLLLVISFLRGLETSLAQSGEADVVMLHGLAAADNIENSSISDQVPVLVRSELDHLVAMRGESPVLSPEFLSSTTLGGANESGERGGKRVAQLAILRGVRPEVFLVRRKAFLTAGQFPKTGEILVGRLAAAKLGLSAASLAVGQTLTMEGRAWRISGHFAAPGTLLEAEIWFPLDELRQQAKRPNDLSLVAFRLNPQGNRREQLDEIEYFTRTRYRELELAGSLEVEYYASLQRHYGPVRVMAWLMVVLVAVGGACGAVNTMYAAVAGRIREFAALQAVGFARRAIGISLVQESVLLAALATLVATGLAVLLLNGLAIRFTMGAFTLQLDALALLIGCGAGLGLGVIGALPPAVRAFRLPIAVALKAV